MRLPSREGLRALAVAVALTSAVLHGTRGQWGENSTASVPAARLWRAVSPVPRQRCASHRASAQCNASAALADAAARRAPVVLIETPVSRWPAIGAWTTATLATALPLIPMVKVQRSPDFVWNDGLRLMGKRLGLEVRVPHEPTQPSRAASHHPCTHPSVLPSCRRPIHGLSSSPTSPDATSSVGLAAGRTAATCTVSGTHACREAHADASSRASSPRRCNAPSSPARCAHVAPRCCCCRAHSVRCGMRAQSRTSSAEHPSARSRPTSSPARSSRQLPTCPSSARRTPTSGPVTSARQRTCTMM
jgi:hypothetical protein